MIIDMRVNNYCRECGHPNGSIRLLLVDDAGVVKNEWPVTFKVMQDFINGGDPADWSISHRDHAPRESYGELVAFRTVDGVEAVCFDTYINLVKFFGLIAEHLGDLGLSAETFDGVLYDVSFEIGNRPGMVSRGDYLGWEEARRGLINDLPDSQSELESVHNSFVCMTRWKDGQGVGIESRPVDPITGEWA